MGHIADRQYHYGQNGPVDLARVSIPDSFTVELQTRYEAHLNRQLQWSCSETSNGCRVLGH